MWSTVFTCDRRRGPTPALTQSRRVKVIGDESEAADRSGVKSGYDIGRNCGAGQSFPNRTRRLPILDNTRTRRLGPVCDGARYTSKWNASRYAVIQDLTASGSQCVDERGAGS